MSRKNSRTQADNGPDSWPTLEVRADLDEKIVIEAITKFLWDVRKSPQSTGWMIKGFRELNRK